VWNVRFTNNKNEITNENGNEIEFTGPYTCMCGYGDNHGLYGGDTRLCRCGYGCRYLHTGGELYAQGRGM
jgi:hypothetical protein